MHVTNCFSLSTHHATLMSNEKCFMPMMKGIPGTGIIPCSWVVCERTGCECLMRPWHEFCGRKLAFVAYCCQLLPREEKGYLGFCLFFPKDPGWLLVIQAQWTRHQQCMCTIYDSMCCLLAYMLVKFTVQCVCLARLNSVVVTNSRYLKGEVVAEEWRINFYSALSYMGPWGRISTGTCRKIMAALVRSVSVRVLL